MSHEPLMIALTHLSLCLTYGDRLGMIVVTLPPETWLRLKHELMRHCLEQSEMRGDGGILFSPPPPEGESWASGFYCMGYWVKCGREKPNEP